MQEKAAPP